MTFMPNPHAFGACHAQPAPIRRPRLLVEAARAGQSGWRRERDLRALLGPLSGHDQSLPPARALPLLRFEEAALNEARRMRAADYNLQRHILFLIAILAETTALSSENAVDPMATRALSARGKASRERL